jgi:GxxExxY protein
MTENDISFSIRGAAFKVHNELGPGLLESVYEEILAYELEKIGLKVETQKATPVFYDDMKFDIGFRLDIFVENKVIIELKSVERLAKVHYKQLTTYLKLTDKKLGLLINFNSASLDSKSMIRIVNNL